MSGQNKNKTDNYPHIFCVRLSEKSYMILDRLSKRDGKSMNRVLNELLITENARRVEKLKAVVGPKAAEHVGEFF